MIRSLHLLGRGNANEREGERQHVANSVACGQTGAGQLGVNRAALARQHLAGLVEAVEAAGQLLCEVGEAERRAVTAAGLLWAIRSAA